MEMSDNIQQQGESENIEGKIFVGGLSWQTTEEGLRFYFEKFGELTDVAIMSDKRTGQPRGFGFICLKDPAGNNILKFILFYLIF
jgi:RNA recognition motif-containing protein